jgi:hypothetical protein
LGGGENHGFPGRFGGGVELGVVLGHSEMCRPRWQRTGGIQS